MNSSSISNRGGTVHANGKRVGFNFPKDPNLQAQWLQEIRRDGKKFKLTEITTNFACTKPNNDIYTVNRFERNELNFNPLVLERSKEK